jgi:PleD family two-component response regulator
MGNLDKETEKKPLRILILEDVAADAELIEYELRKANFEFSSRRVETRETFLRELKDFRPDLILSDYRLPVFDGLSALVLCRELCPETPFILVSGAIGEEVAIESIKSGATDFVLKDRLFRIGHAVKRALRDVEEREERKRADNTPDRAAKAEKHPGDDAGWGFDHRSKQQNSVRQPHA